MNIKLENPNPETPIWDENKHYLKAACAGWAHGVLKSNRRFDNETVEFMFWLAGEDSDRLDSLLNIILSEADKIRLSADIRRSWGDPSDLANITWMASGKTTLDKKRQMLRHLQAQLAAWAGQRTDFETSSLAQHINNSSKVFGLSPQETELCFFFAAINWHDAPKRFFEHHIECDRSTGRSALQSALVLDSDAFGKTLSGKPARIGIIERRGDVIYIEEDFITFFIDPTEAPATEDLFRAPLAANLASKDLGVSKPDLDLVRRLLSGNPDESAHILLYGPPGTGKTTLARALLGELGLEGLEVMGIQDNSSRSRRAALVACLEMAEGRRHSTVLIDEADKILGTNLSWFAQGETSDKGWLTRIFDESPVRTIWIVNNHDNIDPAVLRRFTFSLEMPLPDLVTRGKMLDQVLRKRGIKRHFNSQHVQDLAGEFPLAPAVFETAAKTSALAGGSAKTHRDTFHKALTAKLKLFGEEPVTRTQTRSIKFLDDGVNPACGLESLKTRVRRYDEIWSRNDDSVPAMAMLFHGAPGTGKSVTARHLAKMLDRQVVSRRASDLLGMFVGQTESNIANAFAEAASRGAVLLLDEVDSFLQPRSRANRNWESTLVNEMLVQLESHRGVVIATTNRLEGLDPAALRRFVIKTEFNHLTPEQILSVYNSLLAPLAKGSLSMELGDRLGRLSGVTTADLDIIRQNHILLGRKRVSHHELIKELEIETGIKRPARPTVIGFHPATEQPREVSSCQ